ncbi:hypothetical protein HS7_12790 [Sulfolobales archaeon HS-7]|nr:hypothetical protein HS7_12790 [Sulfolobales archaeon HS-7]
MSIKRAQSSIIVMIAVIGIFLITLSSILYAQMIISQVNNEYKCIDEVKVLKHRESLLVILCEETVDGSPAIVVNVINNGPIETKITGIFGVSEVNGVQNGSLIAITSNLVGRCISPQQRLTTIINLSEYPNLQGIIVTTMYGNEYYSSI